ncbi:hypothetical protein GE061_003749 [Apolygus lucorum]|uniref:Partial AB-hydrolase lipase domain-containing protein n=1 Tax=Apolygus lucorum TaxID=248454 RepID=A0A8S9X4T8_APOLU|nr:hypothetical protein GE061_003749 [Apolygus lucorum]
MFAELSRIFNNEGRSGIKTFLQIEPPGQPQVGHGGPPVYLTRTSRPEGPVLVSPSLVNAIFFGYNEVFLVRSLITSVIQIGCSERGGGVVLCHERRGMPAARRCATVALVLLVAGVARARLPSNQPDPDFRPYLLSTCQRVEARGQACERRQVRTEDGYLLALHRVHSKGLGYGPPILFIHGLLSASDQWLIYGRDHDLGKYF